MEAGVIDPDLMGPARSPNFSGPSSGVGQQEGYAPPSLRSFTSAPVGIRTSPQPESGYLRLSSNYPSPSTSNLDSPGLSGGLVANHESQQIMPPPLRATPSLPSPRNHAFVEEPGSMTDHRSKRVKLGPEANQTAASPPLYDSPHSTPNSGLTISDARSPNLAVINPYSPFANAPMTPGSSIASG